MFSRNRKVTKSFFTEHNKRGVRFSSPSFSIVYYQNGQFPSQFGVIVSKKIAKTAPLRNKTKRVFFSILTEFREVLPQRGVLLIYPNKTALKNHFTDLKRQMEHTLLRLEKLK